MSSVNKVILLGNLGQNPDSRTFGDGIATTSFSLATSRRHGENQETEWHTIRTYKALAEQCAQYLSKGSRVYVEGRIKTEKWVKDDVDHSRVVIVAYEVQFLSPRPQ